MSSDNLVKNFDKAMTDMETKLYRAVDAICFQIVNWIKDNHEDLGGWINRTNALNNSISHVMSEPGQPIVGTIYAGPEYALYVEYKEGHWVLSGGMEEFRNKITSMISEYMKGQS